MKRRRRNSEKKTGRFFKLMIDTKIFSAFMCCCSSYKFPVLPFNFLVKYLRSSQVSRRSPYC
jgi:hypothetical protein